MKSFCWYQSNCWTLRRQWYPCATKQAKFIFHTGRRGWNVIWNRNIEKSNYRKIEMYTYVHATFLEIFEHFNPHNDSHNDPSLRVGSSKFEVRRLVSPCISIDLPVTSELYTTICTQRAVREAIFCIHLPNSEKARSDCFERPQSEYKQF